MRLKILMIVILLMANGVVVSVPLGKGCIIKYVYYDDMLCEGSYVLLFSESGVCLGGQYTGPDGYVTFCDLEYGNYYLNVDWNGDETWDTEHELVVLDSPTVEKYNYYYPLERWHGYNNKIV